MDIVPAENILNKIDSWKYLDALQAITDTIGCSISNENIFKQTLDKIIEVTRMDGAGFRILDNNKSSFRLLAHFSITAELLDKLKSIPIDNPIHGEVVRTHQPVIVNDMIQDPRIANKAVLKLGHKSLICVPVLCGRELVGTIDLLSVKYYQWSENEIRWLMSVGRILGLGIKHVQLNEQIQQISILQERQRISWEIHDGISQLISSIKVRTETIEFLLERGDIKNLRKVLSEISEISDDAYESLREDILGLRGTLQGKGIYLTIKEQLKRFERQWGIKTHFLVVNSRNEVVCPPRTELQVLRIFQEAIRNVRQHANANHLNIKIEWNDEYIQLEVADDGQGFEISDVLEEKHVGLRIMRERAESVGGGFKIESSSAHGTCIKVILPMNSDYLL